MISCIAFILLNLTVEIKGFHSKYNNTNTYFKITILILELGDKKEVTNKRELWKSSLRRFVVFCKVLFISALKIEGGFLCSFPCVQILQLSFCS